MRFGFGKPRPISRVRRIYVHTTENDPAVPAERVAQYQLDTQSGSYHTIVDRHKLLDCNTLDWVTWSTGNQSNDDGAHISFVGWAADTARKTKMLRADWLAEERNHGTLSRGAWKIAAWCRTRNIPAVYLDRAGLLAGRSGISTHDASRQAYGVTTHWDPGPDFPLDVLIDLVNKQLAPTPAPLPPTGSTPNMSKIWDEKITASDGSVHKARELLSYTDGRVFQMTTEDLPRIESKLDEVLQALDAGAR